MRGAYVLITKLDKDSKIKIGRLGDIAFKKGMYCYVGSANGKSVNIENRTDRHRRLASEKEGNLRWHIDYFLVNQNLSLSEIKKFENLDECVLSKSLEKSAAHTCKGFGSSDCEEGCIGHLHYFENRKDALRSVKKI